LPLYIPCHRIIRSDGSLGGYSARGGINLKKKLLKIERLNK
jgi:methylated-DNA-[protein]-cysteine S-methyltransferase